MLVILVTLSQLNHIITEQPSFWHLTFARNATASTGLESLAKTNNHDAGRHPPSVSAHHLTSQLRHCCRDLDFPLPQWFCAAGRFLSGAGHTSYTVTSDVRAMTEHDKDRV